MSQYKSKYLQVRKTKNLMKQKITAKLEQKRRKSNNNKITDSLGQNTRKVTTQNLSKAGHKRHGYKKTLGKRFLRY